MNIIVIDNIFNYHRSTLYVYMYSELIKCSVSTFYEKIEKFVFVKTKMTVNTMDLSGIEIV